jgi:3-phosphoshikimate 1-carboxyvinyltransferase
MAMAFAPLTLIYGNLKMENKEVVAKSYPAFWDDLIKLGFIVK